MFLHREGIEYYEILLNRADNIIEKNTKNGERPLARAIQEIDDIDFVEKLTDLKKHIENITEHISKEDNVLKKTLAEIIKIGKIDFFSSNSKEISGIISHMEKIEKEFSNLDRLVIVILEYLRSGDKTMDVTFITSVTNLKQGLGAIKNDSKHIASLIKSVINQISEAKHLIKTEEQVFTDFEKNMMSWF